MLVYLVLLHLTLSRFLCLSRALPQVAFGKPLNPPKSVPDLLEDLDDAAYDALVVAEIGRLHAQINEKAVCELASSLKLWQPCVIEYPSKPVGLSLLTPCANCHAAFASVTDLRHGSCDYRGFRALLSVSPFLSQKYT